MTYKRTTPNLALTVYADLRWPKHTGIGQVQEAYLDRKPDDIRIVDLRVPGRIGHPLSPLRIAIALLRMKSQRALFCSFGFIPPLFGCRNSVIFLHDLTHLRYYGWIHRIYYNLILKPLYKRCAAIICVSNYTRVEFLAWSGADPTKVHVIKNSVAARFVENKESIIFPYKYVLYPGNHRNYKNLHRLFEAFKKSALPQRNVHLVLTGNRSLALSRKIDELNISNFVHFLGQVPEEQIPKLYRGAEVIAFASLYEGFGLPILEGMASNVPVVTSNISAMAEVAGDAAVLVDPLSIEEISTALINCVTNQTLRSELSAKGQRRIQTFSWDESASTFWNLIQALS